MSWFDKLQKTFIEGDRYMWLCAVAVIATKIATAAHNSLWQLYIILCLVVISRERSGEKSKTDSSRKALNDRFL